MDFVERRGATSATHKAVLDLWQRTLTAVETGDLSLVEREIDWVMKYRLVERYRAKHGLELSSPRVAQLDLAYHDIHRRRGLYYLLQRAGRAERVATDLEVFEAKSVPPQTTRAKARGDFVRRAQEQRRDFTVDWVHLKPERPGAAHGAVQGPVRQRRRARRTAHRGHVSRLGAACEGHTAGRVRVTSSPSRRPKASPCVTL
nr:proteasome accessory factor PafA2 family protein [Angustibacter aerolatus]